MTGRPVRRAAYDFEPKGLRCSPAPFTGSINASSSFAGLLTRVPTGHATMYSSDIYYRPGLLGRALEPRFPIFPGQNGRHAALGIVNLREQPAGGQRRGAQDSVLSLIAV